MDVMKVFGAAATDVEGTLAGVTDWDAPGLGEWTIAELTAHLIRAAGLITTYLDVALEDPTPLHDRVSYFDFDVRAAAPQVADRSKDDAARIGTDALTRTFGESWRETERQVAGLPAGHPIHTIRGTMAVEEYAATRVLELVVHHMDLCRALGQPLHGDPAALALTESILRGLLDGPPPEGLTGAEFVLAATGRDPHDDPRFPVLS